MRILVVGDVGGHARNLRQLLADGDVESALAAGTTAVVQVGDLIDRGPDSEECVALADGFVQGGAGWYQLFGNHEGNRIGAQPFWDEPLAPEAVATIRRWWETGLGRMAVAVRTEELGDVLITHAGLVRHLWTMLGAPDCAGAARALNRLVGENPDLAFSSGRLLSGGLPGVAWADATTELYSSWMTATAVPFAQIHGHSPVLAWPGGKAFRHVPRSMRQQIIGDHERQHSRIDLGGRPFICVDPGLGTDPSGRRLVPLVLEGDILA